MPKTSDSIGIKISELGDAGVIKENDVVPINAKTSAGVPFTKSTKINDLRQTLGFENAFLSVDAGLNGTTSGDVFFVYESAAKLWVLQYQNNGGVANPILGYDNNQVRLPTSRQLKGTVLNFDLFYTNLSNRVFYSQVKGDGSDETALVQSELTLLAALNAAIGGLKYDMTRRGTVMVTSVVCPTTNNMTFDFTGTVFKIPDGTKTLDTDVFRFNSIKDSVVYGLSIDGNRENLPDITASETKAWIGRCILFRIGDGSKNVIFINTTLKNALYCASQWGKNIQNITFQNFTYDNIGEHVFYISGTGGGNTRDVYWKGITGGSFGVNANAGISPDGSGGMINHETAFIKSTQTIGPNDNFVIEDGVFNQTVDNGYAYVILINSHCKHVKIRNIHVGGVLDAIIYPGSESNFADIQGVYSLDTTNNVRLIYSNVAANIIKYTARDIYLPNASLQVHMQLFDLVENSTLYAISTSAQGSVTFAAGKRTVFSGVTFIEKFSLPCVDNNIEFNRCQFIATSPIAGQGIIDPIGNTSWVAGKYVLFDTCQFGNTVGYSWVTQNNNAWVRVKDAYGPMLNPFNRASTTMARLDIDGAIVPATGNPTANVSPTIANYRGIVGVDGVRNFCKYRGQITLSTSQTSNTLDLSNVLVGGNISIQDVYIQPNTLTSSVGVSSYRASVSGKAVTITLNAAPSATLVFYLTVSIS